MKFITRWFTGEKRTEKPLKPMVRSSEFEWPVVRTIVVDGKRRTIVRPDIYRKAFRGTDT
jgi:hypothetical protein